VRKNYDLWNSKELFEINKEIEKVKRKEKTRYRATRDLEKLLQRSCASIYAQLQRMLRR